jgi:transposase, IS5 family
MDEGKSALMLVTRNLQPTLWEVILPPGYERLPGELAAVDALLDDPVFFQPYRPHFSALAGRPSIPIETYLRMMFLKYRYRLGYETLCREVADSLCRMRFCRVPLGTRVPHPSTLEKITTRCGPDVVEQLNRALLVKADRAKVVKTEQVRADTTVVEANVRYPTDSGLLVRAISRIVALVGHIHAAGAASRTKVRDRRRAARRRAHSIGAHLRLRTEEAKGAVLAVTGELADLTEASIAEAAAVLANARRYARRQGAAANGRLAAAIGELDTILGRSGRIVAQTRTRLAGQPVDSATRLVSLHDADARPIVKGRLGKPVEFGYKAQVIDNHDGVVLDHSVHRGNPPDAPLLAPAVTRIKTVLGRPPRAATADRGYGEASVDAELAGLGVKTVVIPRKGKPSAARREVEHSRGFRRLVKWRTGSEGRISYLKHRYGWDRSLFDGLAGATAWCGLGVLAHNTVKIAALVQARQTATAATQPTRPATGQATHRASCVDARAAMATGPPGRPACTTRA